CFSRFFILPYLYLYTISISISYLCIQFVSSLYTVCIQIGYSLYTVCIQIRLSSIFFRLRCLFQQRLFCLIVRFFVAIFLYIVVNFPVFNNDNAAFKRD